MGPYSTFSSSSTAIGQQHTHTHYHQYLSSVATEPQDAKKEKKEALPAFLSNHIPFVSVKEFSSPASFFSTPPSITESFAFDGLVAISKFLNNQTKIHLSYYQKDLEFYLPSAAINFLPEKMTIDNFMEILNSEALSGVREIKVEDSKVVKPKKRKAEEIEFSEPMSALPAHPNVLDALDDFLASDTNLLLLLGESGTGKSLAVLEYADRLIKKFEAKAKEKVFNSLWLPIFIELNQFGITDLEDLLDKQLKTYGLNEADIYKLKQPAELEEAAKPQLLFILDGYDELQKKPNLNRDHSELFKRIGGLKWHAKQLKVIVTCRTRFVMDQTDERMIFDIRFGKGYQRYELLPFTWSQIHKYIANRTCVDHGHTLLPAEKYFGVLESSESLRKLVSNPFVLRLFLISLPKLKKDRTDLNNLSRFKLYQAFFDQLIEREVERLSKAKKEKLGRDSDVILIKDFRKLAQCIVMNMYAKNALMMKIELDAPVWGSVLKWAAKDAKDEYAVFVAQSTSDPFGLTSPPDAKEYLEQAKARVTCLVEDILPLRPSGQSRKFTHISLYEYLVAASIAESVCETSSLHLQELIIESLQQRLVQTEPEVLDFLHDLMSKTHSSQEQELRLAVRKGLLKIVTDSREKPELGHASSNAATILNWSGETLIELDWHGVYLADAELSYAILINTNLSGSNLSRATLCQAALSGVNFRDADLRDIDLGIFPRLEFKAEVQTIAYHPAKPWLAVGLQNGFIFLCDHDIGKIICQWKASSEEVTKIVFSPDGQFLAIACADTFLELWKVDQENPESGLKVQIIGKYATSVKTLAFSPKDGILAFNCYSTVQLRSIATGKSIGELKGHKAEVICVAFSHDGQFFASGDFNGTIRLWSVRNLEFLSEFTSHTGCVYSVAFSPDGRLLASGGRDKTVRFWDVESQKSFEQPLLGHTDRVLCVAFSFDGQILASGSTDTTIRLWDVGNQKLLGHPFVGHKKQIKCLFFRSDDYLLASGSYDGTVRLWKVTKKPIQRMHVEHMHWVKKIVVSHDGHIMASVGGNKLYLWKVESQQFIAQSTSNISGVWDIAFTLDGQVLVGIGDSRIELWNISAAQLVHQFSRSGSIVAHGSDSEILADTSDGIHLWKIGNKKPLLFLKDRGDGGWTSIASSPNEQIIALGTYNAVVLLEKNTQKELCLLKNPSAWGTGYTGFICSMAFSPHGEILAVAPDNEERCVWLWDITNVREGRLIGRLNKKPMGSLRTLYVQGTGVITIAFSLDGLILASAGYGQVVELWDMRSLTPNKESIGMLSWPVDVCSVSFRATSKHSDGWELVIGDSNGSISLWRIDTACKFHLISMAPHAKQSLLLHEADFTGSKMTVITKRVLEQHGGILCDARVAGLEGMEASPFVDTAIADAAPPMAPVTFAPHAQLFPPVRDDKKSTPAQSIPEKADAALVERAKRKLGDIEESLISRAYPSWNLLKGHVLHNPRHSAGRSNCLGLLESYKLQLKNGTFTQEDYYTLVAIERDLEDLRVSQYRLRGTNFD